MGLRIGHLLDERKNKLYQSFSRFKRRSKSQRVTRFLVSVSSHGSGPRRSLRAGGELLHVGTPAEFLPQLRGPQSGLRGGVPILPLRGSLSLAAPASDACARSVPHSPPPPGPAGAAVSPGAAQPCCPGPPASDAEQAPGDGDVLPEFHKIPAQGKATCASHSGNACGLQKWGRFAQTD